MQAKQDELAPRILSRSEHCISRQDISDPALKVLGRLHKAGFAAYLVGGGVRDLLLGMHPKDFDVATDATPEQIKDLFRNCRLIGRRFRLAHIHFGRDIVEVATFRGHHADVEDEALASTRDGMIVRDNVFGTLAEDAWRRDFSVNALYYNIADFSVVDYTGGLDDLKSRRLRMIGDPHVRCQEDPVRILRAMRFAAKLQFELDPELVNAIAEQRERLLAVSSARLYDEVLKLFMSGYAAQVLPLLRAYDIFGMLFAATELCLKNDQPCFDSLLTKACANTDSRIHDNKPVTPAFLFACLLWGPVQERSAALQQSGMSPIQALQEARSHGDLSENAEALSPAYPRDLVRPGTSAQSPRTASLRPPGKQTVSRHLRFSDTALRGRRTGIATAVRLVDTIPECRRAGAKGHVRGFACRSAWSPAAPPQVATP